MMTQKQQDLHIRWMVRSDMPEVLNIEAAAFEFPWTEDDFIRCLRQRNCIGMVAERSEPVDDAQLHVDRVRGYMIYELKKTTLHVLNFAVAAGHRRQGIGRAMIDRLKGKLSDQRRRRIDLEVRETNLPALQFFRAMGFRAVGINRNFYDDTDDDAIVMRYYWHQSPESPPINRIFS